MIKPNITKQERISFYNKVKPNPTNRGVKSHNQNSINISIRLPLELVQKIDAIANDESMSRASVIRSGLETLFQESTETA